MSWLDWIVENNARQYYRDQANDEANMLGTTPDFGSVDAAVNGAIAARRAGAPQTLITDKEARFDIDSAGAVGYGVPVSGKGVSKFDYVNADLAKQYGMNRATAYQEALANTAYQRKVADLQAAGLNPVLAVNGGSGAAGVSSAGAAGDGSSGGSGGSGTSKKDADWKTALGIVGGVLELAVGIGTLAFGHPSGAASAAKGLKDISSSVK